MSTTFKIHPKYSNQQKNTPNYFCLIWHHIIIPVKNNMETDSEEQT